MNETKFHVGDKVRTNLSKNVFGTMPEMAEHATKNDIGVIKDISKLPSGELCFIVMFDDGDEWNYAEENLIPVKPEFTLDDIKLFDIVITADGQYRIALDNINGLEFVRLSQSEMAVGKFGYNNFKHDLDSSFDIVKVVRYKTKSIATRVVMNYLDTAHIDFNDATVMYDAEKETKLKELKELIEETEKSIKVDTVLLQQYKDDLKKLEGEKA